MRERLYLTVVFLLALVADQATKIAVDMSFGLHDTKPLIGDFLRFHYIRNPGAAFGLRFGGTSIMLAITVLVTVVLIYLFFSGKFNPGNMIGRFAVVLVIAGAIGNLIDRIRLKEVIDFIDMGFGSHRWPTYNLADIYVTLGMIALIVIQFYVGVEEKSEIQEN